MFIFRFFIISILLSNVLSDNPKDKTLFISPVKIPILLSANFGELRLDHFHSGIDIKTQGVTGKEIVSASDGYIYRIGVSPGGFGKALYIKHPTGYSTLYGHLEKFAPEIEEYVKARQYEKKSFLITIYPPKEKFTVKQGDLIAYSGNSGSSGGPHLHYEIRRSENEKPVNPLRFEFGVSDNISPIIEKLFIYPVNINTSINGYNSVKRIDVQGGHGNYYIPTDKEIIISGASGFGIKTFDLLDESYNKCAAYSIELIIDSVTFYKYVMDEFSFNESRYINSHIDYETYMKDKIYVQRTYILPNDKLSVYQDIINRGIFSFDDDTLHSIKIIVTDASNNKSTLSFHVKSQTNNHLSTQIKTDENIVIMPFSRQNRFISENIKVSLPAGALYDTLKFSYKLLPGSAEMLSDIHQVNNTLTPVHKAYSVGIKPRIIPVGMESKMLIIQTGDNQNISSMISTWKDGYLTAEVMSFGSFWVGIDTIPPVINPNGFASENDLTGRKEIRIKIKDDLSGIKSYEPEIDDNWALFEYDQKNDVLIYSFDEKRIKRNSDHHLELMVTDNKENTSYFNYNFRW
jgi:hypothetical protein